MSAIGGPVGKAIEGFLNDPSTGVHRDRPKWKVSANAPRAKIAEYGSLEEAVAAVFGSLMVRSEAVLESPNGAVYVIRQLDCPPGPGWPA